MSWDNKLPIFTQSKYYFQKQTWKYWNRNKSRKNCPKKEAIDWASFQDEVKKEKRKKSDFDLRNNKETKCESVLPNQNSRPSSLLRNWKLHTSWIRRKFQERNFFFFIDVAYIDPLSLSKAWWWWKVMNCWWLLDNASPW